MCCLAPRQFACLFFVLSFGICFSQVKKAKVLTAAITSVGSFSVNVNGGVRVVQSVGELGVVASVKTKSNTVQQGFLNHKASYIIKNTKEEKISVAFDFKVMPNPFVRDLKIVFTENPPEDVFLHIYDLNGRLVYSNFYKPSLEIIVPMADYDTGMYLVKVVSGIHRKVKKAIKRD